MGRWYTADHHFGHANIIDYAKRPFEHAHAMSVEMTARWNALVGDDDEVWILGDLMLGSSQRTMAGCVARLRGHKILVPGNHDRCRAGRAGHLAKRADYHHISRTSEIIDHPQPHLIADQAVLLHHFPYRSESRY